MHSRSLRDTTLLDVIATKTQMGQSTPQCSATKDWSALPRDIPELGTPSQFRAKLLDIF